MLFCKISDVFGPIQVGDKVRVVTCEFVCMCRVALSPFFATVVALTRQYVCACTCAQQHRVAGLAIDKREQHVFGG